MCDLCWFISLPAWWYKTLLWLRSQRCLGGGHEEHHVQSSAQNEPHHHAKDFSDFPCKLYWVSRIDYSILLPTTLCHQFFFGHPTSYPAWCIVAYWNELSTDRWWKNHYGERYASQRVFFMHKLFSFRNKESTVV